MKKFCPAPAKQKTKFAGKEIFVTQKPFMEADLKAAKQVLHRLLQKFPVESEVSSVSTVKKVNEEL